MSLAAMVICEAVALKVNVGRLLPCPKPTMATPAAPHAVEAVIVSAWLGFHEYNVSSTSDALRYRIGHCRERFVKGTVVTIRTTNLSV
jgi:hypothetical protein